MSKAFDLSGVGQHGHKADSTPVIDGAELKAAHAHLAKQSQVHEYDSSDQADATGDMNKYQRSSDDVRNDDGANRADGTYRAEHNSNVRDTKSGAPSSNGGAR
jgi:hypothetical protein